jgi:hypothetical protein
LRRHRVAPIPALAAVAIFALGCGPETRTAGPARDRSASEWPAYGGDPGGLRYSDLGDITRENVGRLAIAWTHHNGDVSDGRGDVPSTTAFEATPILVDGRSLWRLCEPARLPRRGHLARPRAPPGRRLPPPDLHRHQRREADRPRCRQRRPLRRLRRRWPRRSRHRRGPGALAGRVPGHFASRRRRRSRHRGLGGGRQPADRRPQRSDPRLRRSRRCAALELGSGTARLRPCGGAGERRGPCAGNAQRVGCDVRRRGTRPGVRADGERGARLLPRPARRDEPLRQLAGRSARCNRRGRVALPDRSQRPLGLRRPGPADPRHAGARRAARSRRDPGHEDGLPLRPRPGDGRAGLSRRRAPGSPGRCAR